MGRLFLYDVELSESTIRYECVLLVCVFINRGHHNISSSKQNVASRAGDYRGFVIAMLRSSAPIVRELCFSS